MDATDKRGSETERRFDRAINKRTKQTPAWFRGVTKVTALLDAKGIDRRARIKQRGSRKPMSVPLQIKSNAYWVEEYYRRHPEAKKYDVPVLVITPSTTGDEMRELTYRVLEPFLNVDRYHFKQYFDSLDTPRLSARGLLNLAKIKKTRKKESAPKRPRS